MSLNYEEVVEAVSGIGYWDVDGEYGVDKFPRYRHRDVELELSLEQVSSEEVRLALEELPGTETGEKCEEWYPFRQSLEAAYREIALSDRFKTVTAGGRRARTPSAVVETGEVEQAARELGEVSLEIIDHYWDTVDKAAHPK